MDQLKQFMRILIQHRFWVLSGVISLVAVGIWFMSTAALEEEFNMQKGKIEGQYTKVNQVLGVVNHPNDFSHKRMDEINSATRDRVYQAWTAQWERQLAVLTWPPELEADFESEVTKLRPAEAIAYPTPPEKEIGVQYRIRYRDYIQTVLPKLAKIIDSNWDAKAGAGGGAMGGSGLGGFGGAPGGTVPGGDGAAGAGLLTPGGGSQGPVEPTHVVEWNARNQSAIAAKYDWSSRPENKPWTLEILYAQEDLWIYSSLMNVIARTNDGADARYKATIKQITSIDLGVEAQLGGAVQRSGGAASGGTPAGGMPMMGAPGMGASSPPGMGAMGAPGGPPMGPMGSSPMGPMGGPAMGGPGMGGPAMGGPGMGGQTSLDPLDNRYVDINLQPLKAGTIRDALKSRDPKGALLSVIKRMPVRLQLVVDIRRLNRLLAECGNSDLPLEIRQVRINRQGASASSISGVDMGAGGNLSGPPGGVGGVGGVGGMSDAGGGMLMPGGRGRVGGAAGGDDDSYETKIEIFGLVYLFNPVNEATLGGPKPAAPGGTAGGGQPPVGATGATPQGTSPPSS